MRPGQRAGTTRAGVIAGLVVMGGLAMSSVSAASEGGAQHASATLRDTTGLVVGFVKLTEDATGTMHVNAKIEGLAAGLHGIHIHNTGSCTPNFAAAGAHHNPLGALHGDHAGDLPNLVVNRAGRGHLNATTDKATLSSGPVTVFDGNGSAVVVHLSPDDFVTPLTGNSGPRIACGVIQAG